MRDRERGLRNGSPAPKQERRGEHPRRTLAQNKAFSKVTGVPLVGPGAGKLNEWRVSVAKVNGCRVSVEAPVAAVRAVALAVAEAVGVAVVVEVAAVEVAVEGVDSNGISQNRKWLIAHFHTAEKDRLEQLYYGGQSNDSLYR